MSIGGAVGGLAGIVFFILSPEPGSITLTPGLALAAGAAAIVLHAANVLLMFGMVTLLKGMAFWAMWKEAWIIDAIQEGALISLGLAGAVVVN